MIDLDFTINLRQFMIHDRCVFVGYGMLAYLDCHINLFYLISQIDPNFSNSDRMEICFTDVGVLPVVAFIIVVNKL